MKTILEEAAEITGGHRHRDYGTPTSNHGAIAEMWSAYLTRKLGMFIRLDSRDSCMMAILQKVSRDAHRPLRDTLVDIAGYAANAESLDIELHLAAPDIADNLPVRDTDEEYPTPEQDRL